jgi:hypothetical protein
LAATSQINPNFVGALQLSHQFKALDQYIVLFGKEIPCLARFAKNKIYLVGFGLRKATHTRTCGSFQGG